mmetsp:Transcript_9862/g.33447  ORF Transcript_9862/g.33447 Transcript_9862/m.33447 type:complete len:292 (+) Transcript_9862:598-1473(+)
MPSSWASTWPTGPFGIQTGWTASSGAYRGTGGLTYRRCACPGSRWATRAPPRARGGASRQKPARCTPARRTPSPPSSPPRAASRPRARRLPPWAPPSPSSSCPRPRWTTWPPASIRTASARTSWSAARQTAAVRRLLSASRPRTSRGSRRRSTRSRTWTLGTCPWQRGPSASASRGPTRRPASGWPRSPRATRHSSTARSTRSRLSRRTPSAPWRASAPPGWRPSSAAVAERRTRCSPACGRGSSPSRVPCVCFRPLRGRRRTARQCSRSVRASLVVTVAVAARLHTRSVR